MLSVSSSGRGLMLVLVLAPVLVRPKGLEVKENDWASVESKQEASRFGNLVDKKTKKPAANPGANPAAADEDPTSDAAMRLLNGGSETSAARTNLANGSTSEGGSGWVWAILASLCVAGMGLAGFSYYSSRMRHAAPW